MDLRDLLARARVLPVLSIADVDLGLELVRALGAGGLTTVEITLRTPAALTAIERIRRDLPGLAVGVGTVLEADGLRRARDAGAQFAVSPGLSEDLAMAARAHGTPYLPGVQTASEIMTARRLGLTTLKFFPARAAGGPAALQAFAPVFPDVAFCPTGGIGAEDVAAYLRLSNVVAVGGSWMAPADLVGARDWRALEALARRIAATTA